MESDQLDPQQARRIAERAEAAPYIDYPPTPWWYAPVIGLWAGALTLVIALGLTTDRSTQPWLLLLVALELFFLRWLSKRHGALPSLRRPPAEFRRILVGYVVGVVVVLALVVTTTALAGTVVGALVAVVVVTPALVLYERAFAAAARRTRARLA